MTLELVNTIGTVVICIVGLVLFGLICLRGAGR